MLIEFSCIYFNVDHFRTGGRCGRKRIRTDSIVDNAVYRLQFAPKSHNMQRQTRKCVSKRASVWASGK